MIDGKDKKERLGQARKIFESALDHYNEWFRECQEDLDFRHSRQWEPEDEQYLRRQNRPMLTFNLIHAKIQHILGTLLDNVQESVIVPVGMEDQLQAEVLELLRRSIYKDADVEMVDTRVFDDGVTAGIGNAAIDVFPDPDDDTILRFSLTPIHPLEVIWDPASDQLDKSDASFLIWTRWMKMSQFRTEYPEHAEDADRMMKQNDGDIGLGYEEKGQSSGLHEAPRFWDYKPRRELLYYDRRREQIRVTHIEYTVAVKETIAINRSGERKVIPNGLRAKLQEEFPNEMAFETRWSEHTKWFEFIGHDVLFDDENPMPFKGFSVIPFVSHADDQNKPYGTVRLLKDPQREFNKRYSQTLHLINSQVAPGIFAESSAVADEAAAEESMKIPGSITWLEPGAVSGQRILPRNVPAFPEAVARMTDTSLRLVDLIAGVNSDNMIEPRGIPEAAATTQLKHRQSLLSMNPVLKRFWQYQRRVALKIIESATGVLSDRQIERFLANEQRFIVKDGLVQERNGQRAASIRSIRDLEYNVELQPADGNETERLMDLQVLMAMQQLGVPIDPGVIFESLGFPRDKLEQLKAFAGQMRQASMQAGQAEQQKEEQKLQSEMMMEMVDRVLEGSRLDEDRRHNMANEMLAGMRLGVEDSQKLREMWANAEEHEKDLIAKMFTAGMDTAVKLTPGPQQGPTQGAPQ